MIAQRTIDPRTKMKKFVLVILNPIRNNPITEAARPA